jgi:hypothetical protein
MMSKRHTANSIGHFDIAGRTLRLFRVSMRRYSVGGSTLKGQDMPSSVRQGKGLTARLAKRPKLRSPLAWSSPI